MKKVLGIAVALLLMMGIAGTAQAYFTPGVELIRISYDQATGVEVGTDLGTLSALQGSSGYTLQADGASNQLKLTQFGASSWSAVQTAYFALDSTSQLLYIATGDTVANAPTLAGRTYAGLSGSLGLIAGYYNGISNLSNPAVATAIGATAAADSYFTLMNAGGANIGTYSNALTGTNAEVNNGTLATQNLWQFVNSSSRNAQTGTLVTGITIQTLNGLTDINPSAVPIPPSVLLMGSGLLGLIGIGRRKLFS
jgi:hypothetical protein